MRDAAAGGIRAGPSRANQFAASIRRPSSCSVGIAGSSGTRCVEPMPRMRTRPSRARPSAGLREQVECFATRQAAERLTEADAEGFTGDHAEALRHLAAGRHRQAYDASVRLHGRIIALARNGRLTQFMSQLGDQVHRFGLMTLRHGRAARALEDHDAIIGALLARDGPAAEALMRAHLRDDREMTLRIALPAGFTAVETAA